MSPQLSLTGRPIGTNGLSPLSSTRGRFPLLLASTAAELRREPVMGIVYQRGCGWEVHQDSVTACALLLADDGEFRTERCRFGTMTGEISKSWLLGWRGCELSGLRWKQVG